MTAQEFSEHAAFDQLSPIGGERHDFLTALVCCVMANLWSKKRHKLKDFMLAWGKKKRKGSTPEQILAYFTTLKAEQDRKVKRG